MKRYIYSFLSIIASLVIIGCLQLVGATDSTGVPVVSYTAKTYVCAASLKTSGTGYDVTTACFDSNLLPQNYDNLCKVTSGVYDVAVGKGYSTSSYTDSWGIYHSGSNNCYVRCVNLQTNCSWQ